MILMKENVDMHLKKIAKGGGIFFVGSIISLAMGYIARIILIRYLSTTEYGIISLANTIYSIAFTIAGLGLAMGVTRQAAYYIGRNETRISRAIFKASLCTILISSTVVGVITFSLSDRIATFFHVPEVSKVIKIFIIALPFASIMNVLTGIFRAHDRADTKFIFEDFLPNILKLVLFSIFVILLIPFETLIYFYILPIIIPSILYLIYFIKTVQLRTSESARRILKPLLTFSMILYLPGLLLLGTTPANKLIVSYYLDPAQLGLYSAAALLGSLLLQLLTAGGFVYLPIATQLYAKKEFEKLRRIYAITTKWLVFSALPFFVMFLFFSEPIISNLYGAKYQGTGTILTIIASGYFLNLMMGPKEMTIIAIGKPKIIIMFNSLYVVLNLILNFLLVPKYGIVGTAISIATATCFAGMFLLSRVYREYRINPITSNLIKPLILMLLLGGVLKILTSRLLVINWYFLILLGMMVMLSLFVSIVFTKSMDFEDVMLFRSIEKRLGINLKIIKKILKKAI